MAPPSSAGRRITVFDRMQTLSSEEIRMIHDASMDILKHTGINFNSEKAVRLFKSHGFKTDGRLVFISEERLIDALESAPECFTMRARNPEKCIQVGGGNFVTLPTGGVSHITLPSGEQRPSTMEDFKNCCKLVQTSEQLDMGGFLMIHPNDLPWQTSHLNMMADYIKLCDKPIQCASTSRESVRDSIEMVGMLFGGSADEIKKEPVVIAFTNSMPPLQYAEVQTDVIMEMAHWRQPNLITTVAMAGFSGPISLPGLLALGNAEILAGIVLSQLVSPGAPVVYGSASAPMDMKTSISAEGAPETVKMALATVQLARYYNVPSRTGGALTDAHYPDAQALAEGALMLSTVIRSGVNVIYHACGQLGSYFSMSFEKWLIDEEILKNIRHIISPMTISQETIDVDFIKSVGVGGQYLTHPKTFTQFRQLSQPASFNRMRYEKWYQGGKKHISEVAHELLKQRLASYQRPPLDQGIEEMIDEFVARKIQAFI